MKRAIALAMLAAAALPLSSAAQLDAQLEAIRKILPKRPALPIAAPAVPVAPGTPALALKLKPGELYKVDLDAGDERKIDQLVVQRLRATAPASKVVPLPGVARQLARDGSEVQLKAFALPGAALSYDKQKNAFVGSILVGVADLLDQSEGKPLSAPVTFQVLDAGLVEPPDTVRLEKTSPPHESFVVKVPSPDPSVKVRVASRFAPQGTAVELEVQRTLLLRADRSEIQGYGLETTVLHIAAYGLDKPAAGREVQLAAQPTAFFERSTVELSEQGTAAVVVRSDASGPVVITATSAGFVPGTMDLNFAPPYRTLAAGLAGGLVGGFLRYTPAMRRGLRGSGLALGLLAATAAGLLVLVLYIVGINVLPVEPKVTVGTAFVFAVAALGGWFGSGLLKSLKGPVNP